MTSGHKAFAGVDVSSGRKPVTFAALDQDLVPILLERCQISQLVESLAQYRRVMLAITVVSSDRGEEACKALKKKLREAGFEPYLQGNSPMQWVETNARDCFRALIRQPPLPRHTLEGRLQRALILHEWGLGIKDPMQFFEEITRHRMMMGVFPNELLYSASELDALIAAFLSWNTINKPVQVDLAGEKKDGSKLVLTDVPPS